MGRKIFVTYKYSDTSVHALDTSEPTKARDYVTEFQALLEEDDHINKGELDDESLIEFSDETIESKLRDRIYDSTITVVMVSKNMKEPYSSEKDQWMPWEISYSLKEHTRNGRTSKSNAMLAVVIPDENGSYEYYIRENTCQHCNCRTLNTPFLFNILRNNMFNIKQPEYTQCDNHKGNKPYKGFSSYITSVKWEDFIKDINKYLDIAVKINCDIDKYHITKTVK